MCDTNGLIWSWQRNIKSLKSNLTSCRPGPVVWQSIAEVDVGSGYLNLNFKYFIAARILYRVFLSPAHKWHTFHMLQSSKNSRNKKMVHMGGDLLFGGISGGSLFCLFQRKGIFTVHSLPHRSISISSNLVLILGWIISWFHISTCNISKVMLSVCTVSPKWHLDYGWLAIDQNIIC